MLLAHRRLAAIDKLARSERQEVAKRTQPLLADGVTTAARTCDR